MPDELETYFADLLANVPLGPVGEADFTFDPTTVPRVTGPLWTGNLAARVIVHHYNASFRQDLLDFQLGRTTIRSLGCALFSRLFHTDPAEICVDIRHPASQAKKIVIEWDGLLQPRPPGLTMSPVLYSYYPSDPSRLALSDQARLLPWGVPWFEFTNADRCAVDDEDRARRDTIVISGSAEGLAELAAFFIDAGRPACTESEFELEDSHAGLGGVAPSSAEARFSLPGSLRWGYVDPPLTE